MLWTIAGRLCTEGAQSCAVEDGIGPRDLYS